jgi:hypothetical protein
MPPEHRCGTSAATRPIALSDGSHAASLIRCRSHRESWREANGKRNPSADDLGGRLAPA